MMSALKGSLVPSNPQNISTAEESNVLKAIKTLASLVEKVAELVKDRYGKRLRLTGLTIYWKGGILSWLIFLFNHYYPPVDSDAPDRWTVISYVSCILTYYIKMDLPLVSRAPEAARLAIRLWLVTDYDYICSNYSLVYGWWDPCIELMPHIVPSSVERLYNMEGVNRRFMINLTLTRIEILAASQKDCDRQQSLGLTNFLVVFNILKRSIEVPSNRIVRVLVETTARLVKTVPQGSDLTSIVCLQYFEHLRSFLLSEQSIEAVTVAIRSGLLRAFVEYSNALSAWRTTTHSYRDVTEISVDATIELIVKTIPRYMVFSSVLSAVEDELQYILDGPMVDTIVAEEWETFRRLFDSNKAFLDNTNLPRLCYCDNLKHDINCNSGKVFRCSGCAKARYCSDKCQKEDWDNGHRNDCQTAGKLKNIMAPLNILRKRDQISVCRFAIMTTILQWKSIQERAQREHPTLSMSQLSVYFDFVKHPHVLHLRKRDMFARDAAQYVPDATIVQCHIKLGIYEVFVTTAGDINEMETKSWVTRAPEIVAFSYTMSQLPYLSEDTLAGITVEMPE